LSIKPEYAEAILDGEKRFELRRKIFRDRSVTRVVIYASSPVKRVVGEVEVKGIIEAHPDDLWERTRDGACVARDFFDEYFKNRDVGYAIEVAHPKRYTTPLSLSAFCVARPPQSFCYLRGIQKHL